ESQFRSDEIRLEALRRRMALEWGESVSALEAKARQKLLDQLVKQTAAFVHVDVAGGESILENPVSAQIVVLGQEDRPLSTGEVSPATSVEAKTQAQGFLLRFDAPEF